MADCHGSRNDFCRTAGRSGNVREELRQSETLKMLNKLTIEPSALVH